VQMSGRWCSIQPTGIHHCRGSGVPPRFSYLPVKLSASVCLLKKPQVVGNVADDEAQKSCLLSLQQLHPASRMTTNPRVNAGLASLGAGDEAGAQLR
jgi:hypothetical protein